MNAEGSRPGTPVLLGPEAMLHNGIHGALLATPPVGISYLRCQAIHSVLCAKDATSPYSDLPLAECVDFGPGDEVVHSVYWPVLHRRKWIVEAAELSYALFCGQYAFTQDFVDRYLVRSTRSEECEQNMIRRARRLLKAYAHESCSGILLYTEEERKKLGRWAAELCDSRTVSDIEGKLHLCCPAVQPLAESSVEDKWNSGDAHRFLFTGRWFESKNGAVALSAFRYLRSRAPSAHITYVGPVPHECREQFRDVLQSIDHRERLDHQEMLSLIKRTHVLVFPSKYESLGVTVIEAMASGAAVVARRAPGLSHFSEWFADGGAVLVDGELSESETAESFGVALAALAQDGPRARAMGLCNYRQATTGVCSLARRDAVLGRVYAAAAGQRQGLTVQTLAGGEPFRLHRATCHASMAARTAQAERAGLSRDRLGFAIDI